MWCWDEYRVSLTCLDAVAASRNVSGTTFPLAKTFWSVIVGQLLHPFRNHEMGKPPPK
jgi:hypothetical protein